MSNNPSDFSHILRPPISTPRSNRDHWRQIFLVLRALIAIADNTKKGSYLDGVSPSSPSAYTVLHIHEPGEVAGISPTVSHKSLDDVHPPNDVNEHHDVIIIRRSLSQLARIVKQKDLLSLQQFGAVEEIAAFQNTDLEKGIHGGAEDQHPPFKNWNTLGPVKDFIHFFFKACKSATIVLLLFCAALSLGFKLKEEGPENGWYDGVTILVAVFLFVTVSATLNFWHARQLHKQPNKKKTVIEVVRDGQPRRISSSEVVVGDIVCLKPGDLVPADGLLLSGCSLKVDEVLDSIIDHYHNPFLFSGAKVINGHGRMVVISLGSNTAMGEMMSWVTRDPYDETTLLQARLDKLGSYTQNIGLLIAILILVALFMRYKLGKKDDETGYPELKGKITAIKELMKAFERIIVKPKGRIGVLTTALTISLVGMQEGLPFVITLFLSYWSKRNICDKAIVKELSTCVTMGSVTTICTEITGGLTSNQVEVDMFMIGEEAINGWDFEIAPGVIEALGEGVGLSVMAPETSTSPGGELLLPWAEITLGTNTEQLKQNCTILKSKPSLNSVRKQVGY